MTVEDLDLVGDGQDLSGEGTAGGPDDSDLLGDQGAGSSTRGVGVQSEEEEHDDPFDPIDDGTEALLYQDAEAGVRKIREKWLKAENGRKRVFTKKMQKLAEEKTQFSTRWQQLENAFGNIQKNDPRLYKDIVEAIGTGGKPRSASSDEKPIHSVDDLKGWIKDELTNFKGELIGEYRGDTISKEVDGFIKKHAAFKEHRDRIIRLRAANSDMDTLAAAAAADPKLFVRLVQQGRSTARPSGDTGLNERTTRPSVRHDTLESAMNAAIQKHGLPD